MDSAQRKRVDDLFQAALERPPRERDPFLLHASGGDEALEREVRSLLHWHQEAGSFLESPATIPVAGSGLSMAGEQTNDADPLAAGSRLGPYQIEAPIGSGGMGEVFRAVDTRIGRKVAIKVSSRHFSSRFEREARTISSLNHPHICTLYDLGPNYLVMELVEGPTLAERIRQGPIPLEESLAIAKQLADALEAAHETGVVHRDLKPANIKIRPDGSVKALDFGLAKAALEDTGPASNSPAALSSPGMILGTAGYMAPEQARGEKVDKRADIWAFGVVLYEMVSGRPLFERETVSDTLAAVIGEDPDWQRVPLKLQRLLRACLEKDARLRLRDIGDAGRLLEETSGTTSPAQATSLPHYIRIAAVALPALIAAALAFVHFREKPPETPVARLTILPPEGASFDFDVQPFGVPALSPDGRRLVFGTQSSDVSTRLWVRSLDSLTAEPLRGTEQASLSFPFWSPDGHSVGFNANGKLKKVDISSGFTTTLADAENFGGGSWSSKGIIVFAPRRISGGPLLQVPAAGGSPTPATSLDLSRGEVRHTAPSFLPDGRHFLYSAVNPGASERTIYVGSLDSHERRIVTHFQTSQNPLGNSQAVFASGRLLFLRDFTLLAQPFDDKRLVTTGEAVPIGEQIAQFTVSDNGTLVYQSGVPASRTLAWLDRTGMRLASVGEPGTLGRMFLSPDGKRAIVAVFDRQANNRDLWIYELAGNRRSRFTFDPADELEGVWSPDGSQIVFGSRRRGHYDLYRKQSSGAGAEELLYADDLIKYPSSWSPDGKFVMYYTYGDPKTGNDIWVLPLGGERKPFPFLKTSANEQQGQFSPDGKWVLYRSDDSGRFEIYVAPFPGPGGKRQVSVSGGEQARWRADGKEIFYVEPDGRLMAVGVGDKGAELEIGAVRPLFGPLRTGGGFQYDVSADGQRILAVMPNEHTAPAPLTVVLNWTAGLK